MMLVFLMVVAAMLPQDAAPPGSTRAEPGNVVVFGDQRIRLWGLATPEPGRLCADDGGEPYDCAARAREIVDEQRNGAREQLEFLAGQIHRQYATVESLRCQIVGQDVGGDPVGRCAVLVPYCIPQSVECDDTWVDLATEVIGAGAGAQRRAETNGAYDEAEQSACMGRLGVWGVADGAGLVRGEEDAEPCS